MPSFSLLTPPAIEPVSLAEAKAHARIDTDADDVLVSSLITAARQWAENFTNRAFITQSWQLALDVLPDRTRYADGFIRLPRAPLQSVTSVKVYAEDDTAFVWSLANYYVDTLSQPGRLALRTGATWPCPTRAANGVIVTYVVGYGDTASTVPADIKTAISQLVAHWYEHRGDAATAPSARGGTLIMPSTSVPLVIQAVLLPHRIPFNGV